MAPRRLYLEALRGVIVMWRGVGGAKAGRTGPTVRVSRRGLTPAKHLRNLEDSFPSWGLAAGTVLPPSAVRSFSSVSGTIHKSPYFFLSFCSLPSRDSVCTSSLRVTHAIAERVCVRMYVCTHVHGANRNSRFGVR